MTSFRPSGTAARRPKTSDGPRRTTDDRRQTADYTAENGNRRPTAASGRQTTDHRLQAANRRPHVTREERRKQTARHRPSTTDNNHQRSEFSAATATRSLNSCNIPLFSRYLVVIQSIFGRYLITIWSLCGRYLIATSSLPGRCGTDPPLYNSGTCPPKNHSDTGCHCLAAVCVLFIAFFAVSTWSL